MMTDEDNIRFALVLDPKKPFVDAVLDAYDELERVRRKENEAHRAELERLREENHQRKQAWFDQWYNNMEIEKCWTIIGGYNRKHLELHEAIREYIRNREWRHEENLHCSPDKPMKYYEIYSPLIKEVIGVCTDQGKESVLTEEPGFELREISKEKFDLYDGSVDAPNRNFPPHSTEQRIKGR